MFAVQPELRVTCQDWFRWLADMFWHVCCFSLTVCCPTWTAGDLLYDWFILDGIFHLFDARWPSESDAVDLLARYVEKNASGLLEHANTLGHTYQIECQNIYQTECQMGWILFPWWGSLEVKWFLTKDWTGWIRYAGSCQRSEDDLSYCIIVPSMFCFAIFGICNNMVFVPWWTWHHENMKCTDSVWNLTTGTMWMWPKHFGPYITHQ